MEDVVLTSKQAIRYIAESYGVKSYYAMSKALSDETLKVQPIQISNYHKGVSRMSQKVADRVEATFDVKISDVYSGGLVDFS